METYEETMETFREGLSLGFSVSSIIQALEESENTNLHALEELKNLHKFGI